jgi:hypothetical protein
MNPNKQLLTDEEARDRTLRALEAEIIQYHSLLIDARNEYSKISKVMATVGRHVEYAHAEILTWSTDGKGFVQQPVKRSTVLVPINDALKALGRKRI